MKLRYLLPMIIPFVTGCTSENYFNELNSPPEILSATDLSIIDTLKIGRLHNVGKNIYFTLPVSITDANANLQSLSIEADTSILLADNNGQEVSAFYDLKHSSTNAMVSKIFRLIPTRPGDYTIAAIVMDEFNRQNSVRKQIHVFDNLPPKCMVAEQYYNLPPDDFIYVVHVDIRSSFDPDEKWGGGIAEYKAIYHYTWQDDVAEMYSEILGVFLTGDFSWETIGWVEAWVIDNEGAESEHIRIDLTLKP